MDQEFTKEQAIAMMIQGQRMTHRYFEDDEFVSCNENGSIYYLSGLHAHPAEEFWQYRKYPEWEKGWRKFEE